MNDDRNNLVTVGVFGHANEAALAKNRLESIGIKAVLGEENSASLGWALTGAQGGVSLLVAQSDAASAKDFLDDKPWLYDDEEKTGFATARNIWKMKDAARDDEEELLTEREQHATRACKSAVFGFLLPPLLPYAMYLLLRVCFSRQRLEGRPRHNAWFAGLILVPVIVIPTLMVLLPAPPPRDNNDLRLYPHPEILVGKWRGKFQGTHGETILDLDLAANGNLHYRESGVNELEAAGSWAFTNFRLFVRLEQVAKGVDANRGQPAGWELEMDGRDQILLKMGRDILRMARQ